MKTKIFLFLVILIIPIITNSQVIKMELTEIINRSDLIIQGKVFKTETKWHEDERGKHIYTYADVTIVQVLKGNYIEKSIKLETMGGKVGEQWEYVSDSYSYEEGQEFILFLDSKKVPIGSHQGKLEVYGEKIYSDNIGIKVTNFKNKIKDYVLNPAKGFSFSENDFIIDTVTSPPQQEEKTVTPQKPINLEIDPNSLKQEEQNVILQKPMNLVIDPNILKQDAQIATPKGPVHLVIDPNSLKQEGQIVILQEPMHLVIDPSSLKQDGKILIPQDPINLKIDPNSLKQVEQIVKQPKPTNLRINPNSLK